MAASNAGVTGDVYDHMFPYHLFRAGERVAIYGAGDIGKKFWVQGLEDRYVELAGIVDRNAAAMQGGSVPVRPVEDLAGMAFDSVLISVHGPKEVVAEIRATLEGMGIAPERAKWDGRTYHQGEFRRNVYLCLLAAAGQDGFASSAAMLGVLRRRMEAGCYRSVFPYRFFRQGERIAIYGGGAIGKDLYRQARRHGYVDVAAIVDPAADAAWEPDVPVCPVEALQAADSASVLIATDARDEAEEAARALMDLGIPEERIFWDSKGYGRDAAEREYLDGLARRAAEREMSDRAAGTIRVALQQEGTA